MTSPPKRDPGAEEPSLGSLPEDDSAKLLADERSKEKIEQIIGLKL